MNSRERIIAAIEHRPVDRVPFDLGSMGCAGIHVEALIRLRAALGLPPSPPRVTNCSGMMSEIAEDLHDLLELDARGLFGLHGFFGFPNTGWKEWTMPNGQQVLVPDRFNTRAEPDGSIFQYPQGDQSAPPSGKMPAGGFYFDNITRQNPIDESKLNPHDNADDYSVMTEEQLRFMEQEANRLYESTEKAIVTGGPGTDFGDIALVPGAWVKDPRGIRDMEEWYISLYARRDYVHETFGLQCEMALANLQLLWQAVGTKVQIILVSGTDFGSQNALLIGRDIYRELFKPFHKKVNDWIHQNTPWKTFQHCCGSIEPLINDFIEAGFDILNPVQCTAAGMDSLMLKEKYGDRICFWGGGLDTQRVLPFGTPDEVREQTRRQVEIFKKGGGYVFTPIHNIQPATPVENILAMLEAFRQVRDY